ncbi:response regulator transcription factor [Caldisalinibacter kiritimatiensis]|uniref:Fructose response regulator of fruA and EII fructose/mannose n=1 Tax=Caldisalinibacter kiritimatiensis TaxID=1304284 RepID=R1AQZ8_9FIRM|nr:response regulator transcription factor [Caldisalinibacter kiritimatiensis]EOC99557.1 fructose response regulator of fruA and EII fructose/mannose [Caldisalinibacter kiritimatiensis]
MIKVLIVDDQDILKEGLKMILSSEGDIEICGLASNGEDAYNICKWNLPDVVLMDIKMPKVNGVEATKRIKKDFPKIKIIVLTTFNDDEYIYDALKYGASGYLLKDATPERIAEAIREVYNGGALIQPNVAAKVVDRFYEMANNNNGKSIDKRVDKLTKREKDICRFLGEGKNNKEIAKELFLSEGTIKNHITNILNKLELRDRTQLAIFSVKNGLSE